MNVGGGDDLWCWAVLLSAVNNSQLIHKLKWGTEGQMHEMNLY